MIQMNHRDDNVLPPLPLPPPPPPVEQNREQQSACKKQLKDLGMFIWRFKYEILGLLNGMIGSLLILLPHLTYVSGWLTTLVGMIIGGFFNWLSSYYYVIHQHDDYSIGKSFQEHFTCTKVNIFYNFYNIAVIISHFLFIIQYLKITITIVKYLCNISKDDSTASIKIEILIFFITFIVIFIMICNKRNIKFMALSFIATIIYCIFFIVQAIRNSDNIIGVEIFHINYLSDMAIALNQGFTIQQFCFQFLKRSEAFEKKRTQLQNQQRVRNNREQPRDSEDRMLQLQQNQRNNDCCNNKHRQFNKNDYYPIILFTYIAGFIFYSILAYAGSFLIHGRSAIPNVQANLQKTILHYYAFNSPQGIIIGVLVVSHFVIAYPEYLLIMIDLMNRVGRNQDNIQQQAQNIQNAQRQTRSLIFIKDFILIFLVVVANTIINHYLMGVAQPLFLQINGSILSFIVLFFIPLLQHFSEFNQTINQNPTGKNCLYIQQRQYTTNKRKRFILNIMNIIMNIFGLYTLLAFFLKLGGIKI